MSLQKSLQTFRFLSYLASKRVFDYGPVTIFAVREMFTDRIRSMGEGNVFYMHLSFCSRGRGLLPKDWGSGQRRGDVGVWSEGVGVWWRGLVRGGGADPPPPLDMATAAVGTHNTGMHSCFSLFYLLPVSHSRTLSATPLFFNKIVHKFLLCSTANYQNCTWI